MSLINLLINEDFTLLHYKVAINNPMEIGDEEPALVISPTDIPRSWIATIEPFIAMTSRLGPERLFYIRIFRKMRFL